MQSPSRLSFRARLGLKRSKDFSEPREKIVVDSAIATSASPNGVTFWPADFLPVDCPNSRILTWGYESNVSRFFGGATDQGNIFDHAKKLLYSLHRERRTCVGVVWPLQKAAALMESGTLAKSSNHIRCSLSRR